MNKAGVLLMTMIVNPISRRLGARVNPKWHLFVCITAAAAK